MLLLEEHDDEVYILSRTRCLPQTPILPPEYLDLKIQTPQDLVKYLIVINDIQTTSSISNFSQS